MINKDTMNELDRLGFGADVDALESYVELLQNAASMGNPMVDDSVYDTHFRLLKKLKPESELVNRNWEKDEAELNEYDEILKKYGMCSITTITEFDELGKFKEVLRSIGHSVELMASTKENGHAVRAIYLNGELYGGTTRGRYKKGRDITRHVKAVLPNYIEEWEDIPIVEVRGEMLVSISNFEKYLKGTLKTPLSSVTSLIRDSVTDDELKLLDMVCYKVIASDDSLGLNSLYEEYEYLNELGFDIPERGVIAGVNADNLEQAVEMLLGHFEGLMDEEKIDYACDGIVFTINDTELFYGLGKTGNSWNANFALKMGRYWESNIYSSTILDIEFIPGKSYITPKARIEAVVASNGAEVTTVPLYNIGVMDRYGYTPGETIYFRFGGETGVTLCDYNGKSVSVNG